MSGSSVGDGDARVEIQAADVSGQIIQAGSVHGDVHFHQAARANETVPRQLPGSANHFVNRAVEQDALTTLLNGSPSDGVVLISTIDGIGGVGKSALVVHWSHKVRDRFPDGDLYVNLRGFDPVAEPMSAFDALGSFLKALGVPDENVPGDLDSRAAMFRSSVHERKMLIVLDNARSGDQVRPLLPGGSSCIVLVTSRNRLNDLVMREGASRLALDVLSPAEAFDLLRRYFGKERVEAEPESVTALAHYCAGLPLALGIVAVRAAENPYFPLDSLVTELHDEQQRLDVLDAGGETGVRAVFSWSYRSLSPAGARLFRLLGLPVGPDIDSAAVAALVGASTREVRGLLGDLTRTQLVEQHSPGRYRFHDLLRAYASECAAEDETADSRRDAVRRLADHYLRTSQGIDRRLLGHARLFSPEPPASEISGLVWESDDSALRWWDAERDNLIAAVRQCARAGLDVHAWQLAHSLMYLFKLRGHITEWIATYEIALESARRLDDDEARAHLLFDLGAAQFQSGRYEETAENQERALWLFERIGDRYWSGLALISLGEVHVELGGFDAADRYLRRALDLHREDDNRFGQGVTHAALGALSARWEHHQVAVEHLEQALRFYREVGEDYGEGIVLAGLARARRDHGRLDEAITTFREAAEHQQRIGHRQGEAETLRELAELLDRHGCPESAGEIRKRAAALFDQLDRPDAY